MADWTNIADTQLDPDAPLTSELAYAWRDNPIAIAEGATGAPRIVDAALGATATNAGRNWVNNRSALSQAGDVGTYMFGSVSGTSIYSFGDMVPEGTVSPASAGGGTGVPVSGNWRCMGVVTGASRTTLFLRVS